MNTQKLKRGDKVAVVSLSSGILGEPFIKHELDLGVKRFGDFELEPVFMKNSLSGIDNLKNNPNLRADDLKQAFSDSNIKGIVSAIGGNDSYKLLPYIFNDKEFVELVKNNPKIFTGYSDTTTIHLALKKLGLNTFYGPAFITDFAEFEDDMLPYTKQAVSYFFDAPRKYFVYPSKYWYKERTDFSPKAVGTPREKFLEERGFEVISGNGSVTGELYGGCIEIISTLVNAQFDGENYNSEENSYENDCVEILKQYPILPNPTELSNTILFLETSDGKPEPEKYRKMILSLKNKGFFSSIKGLLIGKPMDETHYEEYKEILKEELSEFNFPILTNLNFGHSFPRMVLPYGAIAKIDTENQSLSFENSTIE